MKQANMRYKGQPLHHNPTTISVVQKKTLKKHTIPFAQDVLQDLGRLPREVTGEGELYGADCFLQYQNLLKLYLEPKSGPLSLPNIEPFMADFTLLTMTSEPKDNLISYRFVFTEDTAASCPINRTDADSYTVMEGDTLWDIAHEFTVSVEELLLLNRHIMRPDALEAGSRVRLR